MIWIRNAMNFIQCNENNILIKCFEYKIIIQHQSKKKHINKSCTIGIVLKIFDTITLTWFPYFSIDSPSPLHASKDILLFQVMILKIWGLKKDYFVLQLINDHDHGQAGHTDPYLQMISVAFVVFFNVTGISMACCMKIYVDLEAFRFHIYVNVLWCDLPLNYNIM